MLYLDRPDAFSAVECDSIIALAEAAGMGPAPVWSGSTYHTDRNVRDAARSCHARHEAAWVLARLDALFAEAALPLGIAVGPLVEEIQVVRYDHGGHFQTWHTDGGADRPASRLLSASVELSARGDYEGGTLEIVPDTVGRARTLERGGARIFPSRALHRVTPVTRGRRYALVAWTGGPAL